MSAFKLVVGIKVSSRNGESRVNTFFRMWAAAIGAAGCGRCAITA